MCRWFAYISNTEPCLLEDVLVSPKHSLAKQVHDHYLPNLTHYEPDQDSAATKKEIALRNALYNLDGLGVAWYSNAREEFGECEGPRPVIYKILRQPMNDLVFRSICANTSALAVFAHIRAASGETAITVFNNHPFPFGRWTFMHNGVVAHFSRIKKDMLKEISDEALDMVKGTTDSEHLAALFFTYLEENRGARAWDYGHPLEEVKRALERAIATVLDLQRKVLAPTTPDASSLNIAITDGAQLLTIRFRNHPTEHPPSLYISTTAGVTLNRKYPGHPDSEAQRDNERQNLKAVEEHGDHVIVASEPSTYDRDAWELIRKNECIMVGADMVVRRERVNVAF